MMGTPLAPFVGSVFHPPQSARAFIMASKRRNSGRASRPKEVSLDEMLEQGRRNDRPTSDTEPSLRDGNSSKGDLYWDAEDEITTDNDVGDTVDTGEPLAGPSG